MSTGAFETLAEHEALVRCFRRAMGCSGGESRVRRLLFAWYNAGELGGFDLTDLWGLSEEWRADCLLVVGLIARCPQGWYPDRFGFAADMTALVETYGPSAEREARRAQRGRT